MPDLAKMVGESAAGWHAAFALGRIGPTAAAAVPELRKALSDSNSSMRVAAARALGEIGPAAKDAVPCLTRILEHGSAYERVAAARAIGQIGAAATDTVKDLERASGSFSPLNKEAAKALKAVEQEGKTGKPK